MSLFYSKTLLLLYHTLHTSSIVLYSFLTNISHFVFIICVFLCILSNLVNLQSQNNLIEKHYGADTLPNNLTSKKEHFGLYL